MVRSNSILVILTEMRNGVASQFLFSSQSNVKRFNPVDVCFKIVSTEEDLIVLAIKRVFIHIWKNSGTAFYFQISSS